jgi:hypothetical protein
MPGLNALVALNALALAVFWLAALWYPFCTADNIGADCDRCSGTTPATITATISGITDGNCDCSDVDGTYILTQSSLNSCSFASSISAYDGNCQPSYGCEGFSFWVSLVFETYAVIVTLNLSDRGTSCGTAYAQYSESATYPYDCMADRTLALGPYSDLYPRCAGYDTATVSIAV